MIFTVDDIIRDYFAAQTPPVVCDVVFGWRESTSQLNRNNNGRIVVELAEDNEMSGPVRTQTSPARQLTGVNHGIRLRVWARDTAAGNTDDKAHCRKIIDLFERAVQALHHAQSGWLEWKRFEWKDAPSPANGRELVATAVVQMPLFDAAPTVVRVVSPIVTPGVMPGP